jgi:aminotransferase EvaB
MILINDLNAKIKRHKESLHLAIYSVVDRGLLVMGPEVKRLEGRFAGYLGAKHCISVANGTDAIELSLRALGVSQGDSVATVANAGMYTTTAILAIGATPLFLDIDVDSSNTTLSEVERALAAGVRAVVVTHLYGLAVRQIREIALSCERHKVALLEDCAQAHGARVEGRCVGTFGDAASFSFYPTKNLGALGDGGAVITNNDEVAKKVSQLRQYGWSSKYKVEFMGGRNSRLDEIQAATLSVFLPELDSANARRRAIASEYTKAISHPDIDLPKIHGEEYVAHLYVIRTKQRGALRAHLQSCGVATEIHYPIPDHRQSIFNNCYLGVCLKNTERISAEILTLPCYPEMTDEQANQVINAVNNWRL